MMTFVPWMRPCTRTLALTGATPAVVGRALGHATTETMAAYVDIVRESMDEEMQRAAF